MLIVADSSSIINLLNFNALELVYKHYEKIIIPNKVYEELTTKYYYDERVKILNNNKNIEIKKVNDMSSLSKITDKNFHEGEREAIALALETKINNILIDDVRGKEYAKVFNLNIETTPSIIIKNFKTDKIEITPFKNLFSNMLENTMFDKKRTQTIGNLLSKLNENNKKEIIEEIEKEIPIVRKINK